jgi:hypothetical protein
MPPNSLTLGDIGAILETFGHTGRYSLEAELSESERVNNRLQNSRCDAHDINR